MFSYLWAQSQESYGSSTAMERKSQFKTSPLMNEIMQHTTEHLQETRALAKYPKYMFEWRHSFVLQPNLKWKSLLSHTAPSVHKASPFPKSVGDRFGDFFQDSFGFIKDILEFQRPLWEHWRAKMTQWERAMLLINKMYHSLRTPVYDYSSYHSNMFYLLVYYGDTLKYLSFF